MRLGLFRVTLALISFVFTMAIGECAVRIVAPQSESWLAIYRSHPALSTFSMLPNQTRHIETGETEWTITTDAQGFRVPTGPRPEAGCTALWLGDSFTFGHGVEFEESFVGQIEARTPGVRHANAAVSGYGPIQYRQTLEYLIEQGMEFDWVFIPSYVGNDFHDTQWDKNPVVVDGIIGNQADLKSFLKRNSHVYRLLTNSYHGLAGGDQDTFSAVSQQLASPAAWEEVFLATAQERYATEMRRISELATRHGKELAFLILPTRDAAEQIASGGAESEAANDATKEATKEGEAGEQQPMLPVERARSIFAKIGARTLDLSPVVGAFPVDETFFRFDGHFTPEANRRVAEEFARQFDLRCDSEGRPFVRKVE